MTEHCAPTDSQRCVLTLHACPLAQLVLFSQYVASARLKFPHNRSQLVASSPHKHIGNASSLRIRPAYCTATLLRKHLARWAKLHGDLPPDASLRLRWLRRSCARFPLCQKRLHVGVNRLLDLLRARQGQHPIRQGDGVAESGFPQDALDDRQ